MREHIGRHGFLGVRHHVQPVRLAHRESGLQGGGARTREQHHAAAETDVGQVPEELDAVDFRHDQVAEQQPDVMVRVGQQLDGGPGPVQRSHPGEAPVLQAQVAQLDVQEPGEKGVVVDDEDLHGCCPDAAELDAGCNSLAGTTITPGG